MNKKKVAKKKDRKKAEKKDRKKAVRKHPLQMFRVSQQTLFM